MGWNGRDSDDESPYESFSDSDVAIIGEAPVSYSSGEEEAAGGGGGGGNTIAKDEGFELQFMKPHYVTGMDGSIDLDPAVSVHLNEYQAASLQAMIRKETDAQIAVVPRESDGADCLQILTTSVGYLANRVGTGKTRIALALALSQTYPGAMTRAAVDSIRSVDPAIRRLIGGSLNYRERNQGTANSASVAKHVVQDELYRDTLIVVPEALLPQWKAELTKMGVGFSERWGQVEVECAHHRVLITSVAGTWSPRVKMDVARVIYDECEAVQNHQTVSAVKRNFTWLISATPADVPPRTYPFSTIEPARRALSALNGRMSGNYYSYGGLTICPHQMPLTVKVTNAFVNSLISLPPIERVVHAVKTSELRRLHAGAPLIMSGTAKEFLARTEGELTAEKTRVAQLLPNLHAAATRRTDTTAGLRATIANIEFRVRELTGKIARVEEQIATVAKMEGVCSICLDEPPLVPVITACCNSLFCTNCILHCGPERCPYCRELGYNYVVAETPAEGKGKGKGKKRSELKTRDETVVEIVDREKLYLLVGDSGDISRITGVLSANGIASEYMHNATSALIESHRKKEFNVLIFDCKQYGSGLDLSYVDEIILYSDLGNCNYTQVTGRLCRLGRKEKVVVHVMEESDRDAE